MSNFENFQHLIEKALELIQSMSKDEKVKSLLLWNIFGNKIQLIIDSSRNEIASIQRNPENGFHPNLSVNEEDLGVTKDEIELPEPSISSFNLVEDDVSVSDESTRILVLDDKELHLDDECAIDKVLDEVIHLEAEKEILSQLKSSTYNSVVYDFVHCQNTSSNLLESLNPNNSSEIDPQHLLKKSVDQCSASNEDHSLGSKPKDAWTNNEILSNCADCTENYSNEKKSELSKIVLKMKKFSCPECSSLFTTRGNLTAHLRGVHQGERPFCCSKCPSKFTSSANLRRHLISHQGIKPFRCTTCQASFTEKKSLVRHQRSHSGERPFACPHCPNKFSQNSVLQSHLAVHSDVKSISCPHCEKTFKQKTNLKRHISYVHSKVKKHCCTECEHQFVTKSDLERHEKTHKGFKAFLCSKCGLTFMRLDSLKDHINQHHIE